MSERKRILSGMRATGTRGLHIGNYEGALRNWVKLQADNKVFCMIADWHALTTDFEDPSKIRRASLEVAKDFIAGGIDPSRSPVFLQSDIKEHAELHLMFSIIT